MRLLSGSRRLGRPARAPGSPQSLRRLAIVPPMCRHRYVRQTIDYAHLRAGAAVFGRDCGGLI